MSTGHRLPPSIRPRTELSLPPQLTGSVDGESLLHISGLQLVQGPHEGQTLQIRVQWWGDTGAGTLLQIHSGLGTTAARFPIRCSADHFQQYLRDAEWLALALEDRFNGMLGEAALAVSDLTEQRPLAGAVSFMQWLGSGDKRLVATAQLKLLLSFTPIPVPAAAAALAFASDTGYHSSCRSSSSQDSLLSRDEKSVGMPGKPEIVEEVPASSGPPLLTSTHATRLPASIGPSQDQTGLPYDEQYHAAQLRKPVRASTARAATVRASGQLPAATSPPAEMALGIATPSHTTKALEGQRQDRPDLAANTTGKGQAPGLSPDEALSKLIQRAEQLRQMISTTSADACSSSLAPAKTATQTVEHGGANMPSTPAAEQDGDRTCTSAPATLSAISGKQCTQHSTTPAEFGVASGENASGDSKSYSIERTQPQNCVSPASTSGKQRRFNNLTLPVSKLRRLAEGKLGRLGNARASGPQAVVTLQPQGSAEFTGALRSVHNRKLCKDAACQTMPAAALNLSDATQPRSPPTADVPRSHCTAARQDAQVPAAGKLEEPLRQLQHQHGGPSQPQPAQESLVRAHSAPASIAAATQVVSTHAALQPYVQAQRDAIQQATSMLPAADMQHSPRLSRRPKRKVRHSSGPKAPGIAERQAWCNTFNAPRQRPAGQKPRGSSKHAIPPAERAHPQSHLRASLQQKPSLRDPLQPRLLTNFRGQPAKATVQMQYARIPPGTLPASHQDPTYSVMYRLPGDPALQLSPSMEPQACDDAAPSGNVLHVLLDHATAHWVIADDRLGQRLLSTPMLATVLLHHPAKTGNLSAQPVPVGTAEVDLSGLLLPRSGAVHAARRAVTGTYALIHPGAKSPHAACISIKVSLDLDPPGTQQALPELQRAAMPWNPTNTPSAPARQGPEQGNVQNQAGGQAYLGGLRHCLRAEAEAQRQGSLRPATAETSTEYFARMEACTAQPASTHGAASAVLGTMHELGSSSPGQLGRYGHPEDLLAAWRRLSDVDSMLPDLGSDTCGDARTSLQLDDELAWVTRAQLAESNAQEQAPKQAPLMNDPMPDAYAPAMWDVSDSPSMLTGSPDQNSNFQLPYGDHASTLQSNAFLESPEQLPHYRDWSPVLGEATAHAAPPLSSSPQQDLFLGGYDSESLESLPDMGLPRAQSGAELGSALGLQLSVAARDCEQNFDQPSEEDLHAMLARFQEGCSQLPAECLDSNADMAAMSLPCSPAQRSAQQDAAGARCVEHDAVQEQEPVDLAASELGISAVAGYPNAASETDRGSSFRAALYMDCLEPDGEAHMPLSSFPQRTERLATCSDDEDFAVLDCGGASEGSSECSFRAGGSAACHDNVYSAPRGALIMPGALVAADDWLFGISTTLPDSCPTSAPDAPEVHGLAPEAPGAGQSLSWPGRATTNMLPTSDVSSARPIKRGSFVFTNMLPSLPAESAVKEDDWSSGHSLPSAALSAAASAHSEQDTSESCQAGSDSHASGHEHPTNGTLEQPLSAAAAEHVGRSAQPDMTDDLSIVFLSSLSLCSPSACQLNSFPEAIQASDLPTFGGQQQSTCKEEAGTLSLPGLKPAQPEQCGARGLFVNVLPQPGGQPSVPSSSTGSWSNVGELRQGAVIEQPAREHAAEPAAFMNMLPCLGDQPGKDSSDSTTRPRADDKGEQQYVHRTVPDAGMSRREAFRQKLAAAQSAQLGTGNQSGPAGSSPEATANVRQPMQNGIPSATEQHYSKVCMPPLQGKPLHAANADAHDSVKPALASFTPATSPCAAASPDQLVRTSSDVSVEAGPEADAPAEDSSCAGSEPEEAVHGAGGLPDETYGRGLAGVQWAENAAAGDRNDEPEAASAHAIRRMSAAARQSKPAVTPEHSTIPSSTAATALTVDELHGAYGEADNAEGVQGSLSGSSGDQGCGVATTPDEAADGKDTTVHWAENGAGAEAEGAEEPDEALRHAIRRMSAVARERASCRSPTDRAPLSATGLEHTSHMSCTDIQHSAEQQHSSGSHASAPPSLHDAAKRAASPATIFEVGTGQDGKGSPPRTPMRSTSATGGAHAGQAPGSPASASFGQLLERFKGSPAPERCQTASIGPAAQPAAQQKEGSRADQTGAAQSGSIGDIVLMSGQPSGQLGFPQWQHRSPLPIRSPAHAFLAGQTSPPGALGARLRDLEPRQVLPALRALWGHPRKHPPGAYELVGAGEAGESRGMEVAYDSVRATAADGKTALDTSLTVRATSELSTAGSQPAPRIGNYDAEAERIAQIMASVRVLTWQHRQEKHPPA